MLANYVVDEAPTALAGSSCLTQLKGPPRYWQQICGYLANPLFVRWLGQLYTELPSIFAQVMTGAAIQQLTTPQTALPLDGVRIGSILHRFPWLQPSHLRLAV